jgi:hypothetical protein
MARAGSHPGRWRGPLSGVDLPPERWPNPPLVTLFCRRRSDCFALRDFLLDHLVGAQHH